MNNRNAILLAVPFIVLAVFAGILIAPEHSADDKVYFMDNGIRYVVTDEEARTVSVAPLVDGKYEAKISLVIPATASDGTKTYNVTGIAFKAFAFNDDLFGITLPEGLTHIDEEAFHYAAIYQDLVLPSTVTTLGPKCFFSSSITGLDLTLTSLKEIPELAFDDCRYLKWVKLNDDLEIIGEKAFGATQKLVEFDFGNSKVSSIGVEAFKQAGTADGLDFFIPATVTDIAPSAFWAAKINSYNVDPANPAYKSVDDCVLDKSGSTFMFYPINSTAESYIAPDGVTAFAEFAMYNSFHLQSVTLDNTSVIGASAFAKTSKLTSITLTQTTALPSGYKGVIGTYLTAADGSWTVAGATMAHVILDSSYTVDLTGLTGTNGKYIDFTEQTSATKGGKFFKDGSSVTPKDRAGCRFTCVSESASESFVFDLTRYVTADIVPADGGTIEGTGSVEKGSQVTLTAVAKSGYEFGYWNDDKSLTDPTYTITVDADVTVKATFIMVENTFFTVPSNADFQMTMYTGGTPETGKATTYNYYKFTPVDYSSKKDNGDGTVTYAYKLENGKYGAIVSGKGYVTYKDLLTKEANIEYNRTVTTAMLQPEGKSSDYVDRSVQVKVGDDIGGILVSGNKQNHLFMEVGQESMFMAYRHWQAISNWMDNPFLEPDIVFTVTDLNGNNVNNVVEFIDGEAGGPTYRIKALNEGTVLVRMYMQAFTLNVTEDIFYGATWPELTAVFLITVGEEKQFDTGMTIYDDSAKKDRAIDSEVDIFYYDHKDSGYWFTFTPAGGTAVKVYNPVLGDISIKAFQPGSVKDNGDGSYSVLLTEGRNIVEMTKNGTTLYQVLTAMPVVVLINDVDINDAIVEPGQEVKVVFKSTHHDFGGIMNSKGKLAGIYNSNATIYFEDPDGNRVKTERQPSYGHYTFVTSMQYQTLTLTIPEDWTKDTYVLTNGSVPLAGYDGVADHRTWFTPSQKKLDIKTASTIADLEIKVKLYTVTVIAGTDGTVTPDSVTVKPDTPIVKDGNKLTIGSTTFVATPGKSTAEKEVSFSHWDIPDDLETVTHSMDIGAVFKAVYKPVSSGGRVVVDASSSSSSELSVILPADTKNLSIKYADRTSMSIQDAGKLAGRTVQTTVKAIPNHWMSGNAFQFSFDAGTGFTGEFEITLPTTGLKFDRYTVYSIDGEENHPLSTTYNKDGSVTFTTDHAGILVISGSNDSGLEATTYVLIAIAIIALIAFVAVLIYKKRKTA